MEKSFGQKGHDPRSVRFSYLFVSAQVNTETILKTSKEQFSAATIIVSISCTMDHEETKLYST